MDTISIILLLVGIVLALYGFLKGGKAQAFGIIGVLVLLIGVGGALNIIDFSKLTSSTSNVNPGFVAASSCFAPNSLVNGVCTAPPVSSPSPSGCNPSAITSNGLSRADVLYRNVENSTGLGYLPASVTANSNGVQVDSTTTNAGGSGTAYTSMSNIPNCAKGEIDAVPNSGGTGIASTRTLYDVAKQQIVSGFDFTDSAVHKYELRGASADVLSCDMSNFANAISSSWLANGSTGSEVLQTSGHTFVSAAGTTDGNVYFTNTSVGAKGSINFYVHCQVNNTATVYGSYNEPDGVIFAYSYPTSGASKFTPNSLTLSSNIAGWSLNKVNCPAGIAANRNGKACWTAPTMKAGTLYEIKGTLTADSGDPVVGDNPLLYIDTQVLFRDLNSMIIYGTYNSAGTKQGVGGTILNFVVS